MRSNSKAARLKKILRFLNIVLVNVVVFLLAFLVLEYSARAFTLIKKGRSFFRPNTFISCWITTYDYPPPMVSSDGELYFRHRSTPTAYNKPENTMRIIAVGGSTTVNAGAFEAAGIDYSMALERRLKSGYQEVDFEVLNAGGDAFSTAHSLINIQFRLAEMSPDVILLMHNINDSTVNYFLDGATPDYSNKYLQSYFLNPNLQGTLSFTGFLTQSRFLSRFGLPQILANKLGDIRPENDFQYGLRLFRRNLVTIASVCRLHGIELVLLTQPSSMQEHQFVSMDAFLAYNNEIEEVATEHGVRFIDMFSKMGHDGEYFTDEVHYTPLGVERFADIVVSEMGPMVCGSQGDRCCGNGDDAMFERSALDDD